MIEIPNEPIHQRRRYETLSVTPLMKIEVDQSLLTGSMQLVSINPNDVLVKDLEDGFEADQTIIFD